MGRVTSQEDTRGRSTLQCVGWGPSMYVARTVGGRIFKVVPALASPGDPGSWLTTLKGPDAKSGDTGS